MEGRIGKRGKDFVDSSSIGLARYVFFGQRRQVLPTGKPPVALGGEVGKISCAIHRSRES